MDIITVTIIDQKQVVVAKVGWGDASTCGIRKDFARSGLTFSIDEMLL
jgi:hypothetical protein